MRICLVNSSIDGANSPFEENIFADPSRYISRTRHEFDVRWVTKANARAEIDDICNEKFDMYLNYMWSNDRAAGLEAARYLESKGVPVLTNPNKVLAKTTPDLRSAAEGTSLRVPRNTPGKYPKLVKYSNVFGNWDSNYCAICHSEEALQKRVAYLKELNDGFELFIQDYIVGLKCSAIVIEMGWEVVALTPMYHIFPDDTQPGKVVNTSYKSEFNEIRPPKYVFAEDEHQATLKKAAIDAYKAIGATGAGWARIDMRLEESSGHVYAIEVHETPFVFYPNGNKMGDDLVVRERFPGGHMALFDTLLFTKQVQLASNKPRNKHIASYYNRLAPKYNSLLELTGMPKMVQFLATNFAFSGTVLDVACGTGAVGRSLIEHGAQAEITGIDFSEAMIETQEIKNYYKQPILLGPMQEILMGAGEYDHILCIGALYLLEAVQFNAVLARMFMLARKSISFELADIDKEFVDKAVKALGELFTPANHLQDVADFGVPNGWRLAHKRRMFLFKSPSMHEDVEGYLFRYERL